MGVRRKLFDYVCEDCHAWITKERAALQMSISAFPDGLIPLLRGFADAVTALESDGVLMTDEHEVNHCVGSAMAVTRPSEDLVDAIVSAPGSINLRQISPFRKGMA
jgi:hypothetical protein